MLKKLKTIFKLNSFVLVSLVIVPVYGQDRPIGIFQAVDTGYIHRPDLKKIAYDIRSNREMERAALSGYLPQIQVQAGVGAASGENFFTPKRFALLSFSQLLYNPAGPIERYKIARQDTRILEWQNLTQKNAIRYESTIGLLDLWDSQQKDSLVKDYDLSSKLLYGKQLHEYKLGLSNQDAWMRQTADFVLAQARVRKYIDELTIASSDLERTIGIVCTPKMLIDTASVVHMIDQAIMMADSGSVESYFQEALANRQELYAVDEAIAKETYWERFYCKSYLPSISLYADVIKLVYNDNGALFNNLGPMGTALKDLFTFKTGWVAGLKFDWRFDGLENVFNAGAAEERALSATMDRLDKMQKIKQEVFTNHATLQSLFKEFKATTSDYKRAYNEIILKRKQFEVGLISPVDMRQEETIWLKAQHDYLSYKVTIAKQYQRLLYSCGYPDNPQKIAAKRLCT